jgi:hypothetical protein
LSLAPAVDGPWRVLRTSAELFTRKNARDRTPCSGVSLVPRALGCNEKNARANRGQKKTKDASRPDVLSVRNEASKRRNGYLWLHPWMSPGRPSARNRAQKKARARATQPLSDQSMGGGLASSPPPHPFAPTLPAPCSRPSSPLYPLPKPMPGDCLKAEPTRATLSSPSQ